jgi:hypothetical protein
MGNNKEPQTVSIDGKEYNLDDFTQEQKMMLDLASSSSTNFAWARMRS